jgi:hypothetical protein
MILLLLLPFYDRGPERRPALRPIATVSAIFVIAAMALLTYAGADTGSPNELTIAVPSAVAKAGPASLAEFEAGRKVAAQSGCEACHLIGSNGNNGPGPELTTIGARLPAQGIARTLVIPTAPMPSFKNMPATKFESLVYFLSQLK